MTATEELRRLLDECEVEWSATVGANGTIWTHWDAFNGQRIHAMDNEDGTVEIFDQWDLTPEQAIAATLGAGTCQDLGGTGANDEQVFNCSECGCVLSLYDRDGSNNLCTSFIFDYPRYCPECGRKVVNK